MAVLFRPLKAGEIECRIGQVSKTGKGLSLLLYKTARTDMALLDETLDPFDWKTEYEEIKGVLNCTLSIFCRERGEWVSKQAAGTESNMEAAKGESSDALKRAGFLWGIGRELYTAPFIWVKAQDCNIQNGKCYDRFEVDSIETVNGKIAQLSISNASMRKRAFTWGADAPRKPQDSPGQAGKPQQAQHATADDFNTLQGACNEYAFLCGKEVNDILDALAASKAMQAAGFRGDWTKATRGQIVTAHKTVEHWIDVTKRNNKDKLDGIVR